MKKFARMPVVDAENLQTRGPKRRSVWWAVSDQIWQAYPDEAVVIPIKDLPGRPEHQPQAIRRVLAQDQRVAGVEYRAVIRTIPGHLVVWLKRRDA